MGRCVNAVGYPDANVSRSTRSNRFEVKLAPRVALEETNRENKPTELTMALEPFFQRAYPHTIENHPAKSTATSGYKTKGTNSTIPGSGSGKSVPQTNSTSSSSRSFYSTSDGAQPSNEGHTVTEHYTLNDDSEEEVVRAGQGIRGLYGEDWTMRLGYTQSHDDRLKVYRIGTETNSRASSAPAPIEYLNKRKHLPMQPLCVEKPTMVGEDNTFL